MAKTGTYEVTADIPEPAMENYLSSDLLAVDTEMQGLQLGRDQVCLVQLCDRKGNVSLVRPVPPNAPANLKKVLTAPNVTKLFHYAISDVAFLRSSLGIEVHPYRCTKVMSKLVRTYSDKHSLKTMVQEFIGLDLSKENQSSNWGAPVLGDSQLEYAANDVLHLISIFEQLTTMIEQRGNLPTGLSAADLNRRSQESLPVMVDLVLNGYGDRDRGWETSLFSH